MKNWDRTRCFVRQRKVIYGQGEDNILGQGKVILLAGEVVHGTGEVVGQEKLYMGQESSIGWDRRKWLDGTGEVVYGTGEFDRMGQEKTV